jgi:hypothetical protein
MSLINDALKQARQAPQRNAPNTLPPLHAAHDEAPSAAVWIIPAVIIFLIVAAIFFIGWASAHHTARTIAAQPTVAGTQIVAEVTVPVIAPRPEPVVPVNPPEAPTLQGIFYSATDPTAIVDGKTVGVGDRFKQYRVKEITKYTVILTGADGKDIRLGMSR